MMIIYPALLLMLLSICGVGYLFWLKGRSIYHDDLYTWGRVFFLVFGVAVFLLGVAFYREKGAMMALLSPMFLIVGAQITLWAAGVTSEFLGNASTAAPHSSDTRGYEYDLYPYGSYEKDRMARSLEHLEDLIRRMYQLEYDRYSTELKSYEVKEKTLSQEEKKRDIEAHKGPFRQFYNHLLVAISILKLMKQNEEVNNVSVADLQAAFRVEVNEMLSIAKDNADLLFKIKLDEKIRPFLDNSAAFRFEPIENLIPKLDQLTEIADKLKSPPQS